MHGTLSVAWAWRPAVGASLPRTLGPRNHRLMRSIALAAIRFYKRRLSPHKGFCCAYRTHLGRFSCSTLGYRAIRRFGVLKGMAVLRQRTSLCAATQRRALNSKAESQRGSAPCDLPCDLSCIPDCSSSDFNCKGLSRYVSCCDVCSCDWPERKKKPESESEPYLPPPRPRTQKQ